MIGPQTRHIACRLESKKCRLTFYCICKNIQVPAAVLKIDQIYVIHLNPRGIHKFIPLSYSKLSCFLHSSQKIEGSALFCYMVCSTKENFEGNNRSVECHVSHFRKYCNNVRSITIFTFANFQPTYDVIVARILSPSGASIN